MNKCLNKRQIWGGVPFQLMIVNITVGSVSFLILESNQIIIVCVIIYVCAKIIYWYEPLTFYFLGSYLGMSDLIPDGQKGRYGKSFSKSLLWKNLVGLYNSGVILQLDDGSFKIIFKFQGIDFLLMSLPEIQIIFGAMNRGFKLLAKHEVTIFWECRRSECTLTKKTNVKSRKILPYIITLMQAEREKLNKNSKKCKNETFLTLIFKPPTGSQKISIFSKIFIKSNSGEQSTSKEQDIETFKSILNKFINVIPADLKLITLNKEQTFQYLHSHVSTKLSHLNPLKFDKSASLSTILPDQPLYKGLSPVLGNSYIKAIGIKNFPNKLDPEMRNKIGRLPVQFRWITRMDFMEQNKTQKIVKNKKIVWANSAIKLGAVLGSMFTSIGEFDNDTEKLDSSMADDCQIIMDDLKENKYALANVNSTIIVMNKDEATAIEEATKIRKIMENYGIDACIENINTMPAFLASIPGSTHKNPRKFILTSKNLINCFLPLSNPWEGSSDQDCLFTAKGRD